MHCRDVLLCVSTDTHSRTMIKLSDYIIRFIADQGVKDIFLLPGGGAMHLVDSVGRNKNIRFICNLHEQACAIAADAYGQYTNNLGVALVTTGPGGTNTITGVAAAWLDSTPCLFISGQVKRADLAASRGVRQMGFQEIDIVRLVGPITKYAVMITEPDSVRYHLEKAVFLARSGRPGPVWLDVPLDVQAAMIDEDRLPSFDPSEIRQQNSGEPMIKQVASAIQLLNQAERPVILVGNGVRLAKGIDDFLRLIDLLRIPVLTSWKAMDFLPDDHPLYAGRPGSVGQRGANFSLQNSDWLLAIGARLDFGQIGFNHQTFARAAKKIMVDIDPAELAKLMTTIDVSVCADAGDFLQEFLHQFKSVSTKDWSGWLGQCKEWQRKYPVGLGKKEYDYDYEQEYEKEQGQEHVDLYALISALSEEMVEDDLLIPGSSGACSEVTMQAFKVKSGQRIFNSEGLGPMGFGIPASLGGCIAGGGKRTVCIDGDGGFQMNSQELETIRRLNLPIKFFVLNNRGYGSIRITQHNYFAGHLVASSPESGLTLADVVKLAKAYGLETERIENNAQLRQRVKQVLEAKGPVVCEVMISPEQISKPRLSSAQRADGSMVSKPLEDLWPFLDREEFLANMMIPVLED
jgi:acetolactate synthase-1/2/3 large subunit